MKAIRAGYKQTDVGVVPEDWRVACIGELASTSSGTTPARAQSDRYFSNGSIPWVKTLDLNNGPILETDEAVTPVALAETCLQPYAKGTVLVAMYGGYNQIGRTGILEFQATVNQALTAIRADRKQLYPNFLLFVLNHRVEYWRSVASSSRKDPNITGNDVRAFPLAVPPLAEQEAIAEALSDSDALIESLEQLLTKKRHLKQAAMQELLTGKKRLPGLSGEWEVKRLGELFAFSGGYTASRDQLSMDGHCYLHYGDIHKSSKAFIDVCAEIQDIPKLDVPLRKISATSLLGDGDVVFVDASEDDEGTSKHVVVMNKENVPFISGLHTIVAKSKSGDLDHGYRRYCFQTRAIREQFLFYAVGTKVSGISKTNIAKINLPIPPVPEQEAIAAILVDMDTGIAELECELTKTRALKQGMMQKLLTGEIRLVGALL